MGKVQMGGHYSRSCHVNNTGRNNVNSGKKHLPKDNRMNDVRQQRFFVPRQQIPQAPIELSRCTLIPKIPKLVSVGGETVLLQKRYTLTTGERDNRLLSKSTIGGVAFVHIPMSIRECHNDKSSDGNKCVLRGSDLPFTV